MPPLRFCHTLELNLNVYYPDKLDADKQKGILKGIKDFIKTKDFKSLPSPDRVNQSDAYRHRTASEEARQRVIAAQAQTLSTAEIEEYANEVSSLSSKRDAKIIYIEKS